METKVTKNPQRLAKVWFWTVEVFALGVVGLCWASFLVPAAFPWTPGWVFSFLKDFSSGVMAFQLLTVFALWRKHRWLASGGLLLCALWVVWVEMPRMAAYGSNQ